MEARQPENETLATLGFFPLGKTAGLEGEDAVDVGDGPWQFRGIASDETPDVEDDAILRKALDLSYAAARGFVNWDHSGEPEHQIGYLERAELIAPNRVRSFQSQLPEGVTLSKSASVFVQGTLYKFVPKAEAVAKLIKSAPPGKGVGMSLQGAMARDTSSGDIVRAFVRGIAITPVPAHPMTMVSLAKSLRAASDAARPESPEAGVSLELLRAVDEAANRAVAEQLAKHGMPAPGKVLTEEEAILATLRKHPHWTYSLARDVVRYAIQKQKETA